MEIETEQPTVTSLLRIVERLIADVERINQQVKDLREALAKEGIH
jgi:hypothetical protein